LFRISGRTRIPSQTYGPKLLPGLQQVDVKDFYDELPKKDFTLTEWIKFCADHPEYLIVNKHSAYGRQFKISHENVI
jgi:hypothetical protein